jgi:hypothetical protein
MAAFLHEGIENYMLYINEELSKGSFYKVSDGAQYTLLTEEK